ncbi:hypothetical protein GLOIN_2v1784985 [Rhizophagus irregularis DAOM 181602=DAOM 197198]|uniref:DH domain-containing protein n=1 Tax=Rhizophagus irregularis (strain DAOM 181602 / DAOM 197198 / MUCL 43194) TaxID=747089 RepID=A0A2P4PBA8_RHIID|nr:hypothetical protein GLOIN_2v1784985 [Rhizophagus irregularis DAOM 181602=DAOM 197198]POG62661.1 hypothetical protein GLOIN_2v1784985 [Rhizophagus irregularis DAOM 181602=DAOM 197198]|eukprot:XP_025169527.1 hypothetical protein GLOIN_2v1784985 [Rhizophagus irregularis DAOM 181602=DAOM 197198]
MDEETSLKGLKERRLKVAREYRLRNLKRVADKNLALHKIAKKNTFQAIIFSLSTIFFGAIFVFLDGNSGITDLVENAAVGVGSLMTLLTSFKDFMTKTSTDEDCIAIKFSEVSDESVDLSLKTTDEDDIRNTENTIECWCKWLQRMKSFYTTFTLFSSLLLIVFIILNFTSQGKNVISINVTIIIFGGISLILAGTIRYSLSIFTFSGDGGKDIDRLLNGMKIHIKRNTALDLENLLKGLFKPYDMKDDKQEFDNSELSKTTERLTSLVENDPKKAKEVQDAIAPDIALWIWKLYTAMEELDFMLQKNTNSQSELNMKKLMKKLSLKELVKIILDSEDQKYHFKSESTKLTVDYHILRELYGASKELLNIVEKENEKKNEQPSKKGSDGIEEEFTKITKELEVIKQIMEKSKKSHTKEFTDFTNNLIGELDGIKERLKYINQWAEGLNNFTDPTSAQVDQLREEIPKILNCDNLEKYDEKWKKTFYKTSKQEDTNQTLKQKDPPNLKEITNLPLILYEIEKELSEIPKILKEIDQKIETPIEDLRYAKIINRCAKDKLDDIEKKLFEMHDNIRKDLMNREIAKIEKNLLKVFIEKLSNTLEIFETENVKELKEFNEKLSKVFKKFIEKKLSNYNSKCIGELSKTFENFDTKNVKEFNDNISEVLKKFKVEEKLSTEEAEKFFEEFSKNSSKIKELYKKIDELKKETSQKTSKEESKESKESKESLELLERLLKELRQISKVLILNDHIKSREKNNYNKEEVEKKLLKVFIEELSNTFEEFETENVKEFNDIISEVLKKFIKNKLSNYKVEEEFSKILNNYNDFKTEKAIKFIEEISKKSDNSEIKIEKLYIEEPELSKNSDNSEIKIEKLYEIIDELKKELSKIHDENHFKTSKAKKIIDKFSKHHDNYPNIEKLYEKIDGLKKETCQITSREESKELKELLERLLKELHQISKEFILKEFIKLRDDHNYTKLHEWLNEGLSDFTELLNKNDNDMEIDKIEKKLLKVFIDKLYEILNLGKELSNTLGNVKEFNDKISEVIENKLSNYKVKENLFEENDETSQKELLKKWYPNELHQISKELILKEFIKLRDDHNYSKLHKGLNELEKLQKLLNKDDEEIDYSKLHKELLKSMEINNEEIDNKDIDKIEKKLLKVFIEELSNTGNVKEFNNIISEVLIKFIDNELSSFMKKVEEKLPKIPETEKANKSKKNKFIEEISKNSDNSEIKIEKLFENFDELKKETSQKTSREESQESKELKELLERLLKELDPKELHQISKGLILRKFIELRRYNYYTKLHKGLNELNYFTEFEKLHKLFKEINQKTFHSINLNYSTHLVKDEYFFKHLYYEIVDSIKEVEDDVKLNPVKSYIDFGKHFGTHLFQNFIPDGKRKSDKVVNQKLIRCYYRLGELLFSDNDGENAPKKVTDLQHRKAKNFYDLYNKMLFLLNDINVNNNVNKLPINMIKGIKSQYATTIFAISNDDVTYLTRNTRNIRSKILYVLSNYYVNYLTRDIRSKINDDVKKETENQSSDVKKTKNQISDVKETENQSSDDYEKSDYYDKSDDYEKSNDYIMQIHLDGNKEGEQ